jgi:hypothetical protein
MNDANAFEGAVPMTTYALPSHATRPSGGRLGYGLAAVAAIGGLVLAIGYGAISAWDAWRAPDGFERTTLGRSITVELAAGEDAVVYLEGGGASSSSGLGLEVMSPAGIPIAVAAYPGTLQYDRGDVLATAIGRFTAPLAGAYEVRTADAPLPGVIAVGEDIGAQLAGAMARAGLIAGIGIALCAAVAIAASIVGRRPAVDR